MARYSHNFTPIENKTITFAAGTTSQNIQFATTIGKAGAVTADATVGYSEFPSALQISNRLTVDCFVAWGVDNTVAATVAGSYAVAAGAILIIDVGQLAWVAVIPLSSATGNVYLARGLGH